MQSTLYALTLEAHREELKRQAERRRHVPVRRRRWFGRNP
jgi:hypothetical protein